MTVIVDGIEYVPKAEIPELTDERLKKALDCLIEIQYFPECHHKHRAWAFNAIEHLAPELSKLTPEAMFERINGTRG